ncbi:MAG: glycosyltransferase family 4 protein, partial [Acidobacteria bacterium]|nr:glycosyltransferase family 4 protein [Acidobacteriota bacterium]
MLRVLHIITRLELGGAQRNTLFTAGNLDRSQFSVGLAWGPGDELDSEAMEIEDLERFEISALIRPIAPRMDLRALRELRRAISSFSPDIVHTHSSKAGILGRRAAHLEKIPVVIHSIHGWGFTPLQSPVKRRLLVAAERWVAPWTDHFIAVSQANIDQGRALGLLGDDTSLIRSGIDLSPFRQLPDPVPVRRRLDIPDGVPVVTQIGNLKSQKAPLDFVRVAAIVASTNPEVHFVMAGDGPLRAQVEDLAGELEIADRLHLPGWWHDVPGLLAATDVAVLTSRHEGLPRAVVEALAAGVPVVATAVDGTPEVVRDGINGFLAPPGEVELLAAGVCTLLEDDDRRKVMG